MIKKIVTLLLVCYVSHNALAQKKLHVTVNLDQSIDPKKVTYYYNDGQRTVFFNDTLKRQVIVKGVYFSTIASFHIGYVAKDAVYYMGDFFIDDKRAEITLRFKPNIDQLLYYDNLHNARPIYDTRSNTTYKKLTDYNKPQNLALWRFAQENKGKMAETNSLGRKYYAMLKAVNLRAMNFLKQHANDYFSFWHFANNFCGQDVIKDDPEYLKYLITYFKTTFPAKYTQSYEGRELLAKLENTASSATAINKKALPFTIKTLDNKVLTLNNLRGKYVLLNFWATWCGPCMAEIPFIKQIRKSYADDKLAIIGISQDVDVKPLKRVISERGLNWMQYYDRQKLVSTLYKVNDFPTLVLLDREGKIVYRSSNTAQDSIEIPKLLQSALR
jgi:thiol-disulfide isomerase/thioredoxin